MKWNEIFEWRKEEYNDIRFAAYSYLKEGQYDIAITFFHSLLILDTTPYDLQTLGALYLQKGDNLKALQYLDQSIKLEQKHLPTLLNRAKALIGLGYKKQAATQLKSLVGCENVLVSNQAEILLTTIS